jgi:biotin operon repressor
LPRDVQDRLATALAPFRNREAAFTLAVFLARFWSSPGRISEAFHIDRRALAEHGDLDLSEKQIRSAIRTLEEIGFLDRAVTSGSRYKATEDGLRRKPIRFQFGSEYAPLFIAANNRAAAARGGHSGERRALAPSKAPSRSTVNFQASPLKGPKSKSEADRSVNLGPLVKESGLPAKAFDPDPSLEAALARFEEGFRRSRGG